MEGNLSTKPVGIIGAGSFGTAIAKILATNTDVLLYSRNPQEVQRLNSEHMIKSIEVPPNVKGVGSLDTIGSSCNVIFPIVPSASFREVIRKLSPHINPAHFIIHGTKGLDVVDHIPNNDKKATLKRSQVHTMSEVILQETSAVRVGCLSGPNLAREILENKPTATVIASRFQEVVTAGEKLLNSKNFHVFGTNDILGAEMAGAFKNAIAIGSGILGGLELGKNIQSILITRGLREMIFLSKAMGADVKTFFGTAGIGDLVATTTSTDSRNYSFGLRIGKGENRQQIEQNTNELAEGVRTVKIMKHLADNYNLRLPIIQMIYTIIFEDFKPERAVKYLMKYPYGVDVDFL